MGTNHSAVDRQCLLCLRLLPQHCFTNTKAECKQCRRDKQREFYKANRDKILQRCYETRQFRKPRQPKISAEQEIAYELTKKAIRSGEIKKACKCEICGSLKPLDAHHFDYSRPTDVLWLCKSCHKTVHLKDHDEGIKAEWIVRYYMHDLDQWVDVSGTVSEEQADKIWDEYTGGGAHHTQDDEGSYYEVQRVEELTT